MVTAFPTSQNDLDSGLPQVVEKPSKGPLPGRRREDGGELVLSCLDLASSVSEQGPGEVSPLIEFRQRRLDTPGVRGRFQAER